LSQRPHLQRNQYKDGKDISERMRVLHADGELTPLQARLFEPTRPAEELYDIQKDPACLDNLAGDSSHRETRQRLAKRLTDYLLQTGDVRVVDPDNADVWETYPRVSHLRWFPTPDWASENPGAVPKQPWLEQRKPQ